MFPAWPVTAPSLTHSVTRTNIMFSAWPVTAPSLTHSVTRTNIMFSAWPVTALRKPYIFCDTYEHNVRMSKSVHVRVFHGLELLRYDLRCAIASNSPKPYTFCDTYEHYVLCLACKAPSLTHSMTRTNIMFSAWPVTAPSLTHSMTRTNVMFSAYPDNDYQAMPDRKALPEPSKGPEPVDTNTYDIDPILPPSPPPPAP